MAYLRKLKSTTMLRCLVVPALFLCAIFKKPAFQWIAVATLAVWLCASLSDVILSIKRKRDRKEAQRTLAQLNAPVQQPSKKDDLPPESELFLIRQVNFRITEQLKATYPMVSWLWVKRPSADDLCKGGVWRIRLANTEPFNFGEVELNRSGKITITLLQATPLKETEAKPLSSTDLEEDELLDRVDVKSWYDSEGEKVLAQMIDDLNTQGHRKLMIHESGEVVITASGTEQVIDVIQNFPPRLAWDEFCQVLREDEITATIQPDGLALSW